MVIKRVLKIFMTVFLFFACVSCSGSNVSITKDTFYEEPAIQTESGYLLGPGDSIEITFFFGTLPSEKEYVLGVGDEIGVEFYFHKEMNKIVTIYPDGKITLPRKGDISAVGLTTRELKEKITKLYSDTFKDPLVTINLIVFNQALKGFKEAITSDRAGHTKVALIRPDGFLSLDHIEQDIRAAGLTVPQLKTIISEEYRKKFDGLIVSLALANTNSNLVYVSGEVRKPDSYQLIGPTTAAQILSKAGLILETAELKSIIVISRGPEGRPIGRLVDLDKVLGAGNIGHDVLLKRFDIVYVPKNKITQVALFIDQYFSKIMPSWVRLGFSYRLNDSSGFIVD